MFLYFSLIYTYTITPFNGIFWFINAYFINFVSNIIWYQPSTRALPFSYMYYTSAFIVEEIKILASLP